MLEKHRTNAKNFTGYIEDEGYDEYNYDYDTDAMQTMIAYMEMPRTYTTANDFFLLEASKGGALYDHIYTLYEQGMLTATTRRTASLGAKDYLMGMCQNDITLLPRTPQTEGLVIVVLIGYASKINVQGLLSGDNPIVLDKNQLVTACTHAGATVKAVLDIFMQWHPTATTLSHLTALTPSITHNDRKRALSDLYGRYKSNPTDENALKIVLYLMPIEAMRVCQITDTMPTLDQANIALDRAHHHGSGYEQAVNQYIESVKKGSL